MSKLPLTGIRIIDLSHSWAAPHCSRILADFGAEVIKVEYPRRLCILRGAKKINRNYDSQPAWHQVNRNKLGITLDLKVAGDRDAFVDLVKISDVVVENSRTMVSDCLGFGYSDLTKLKKDIIMVSMSAFGHSGPFSNFVGYGAVFEAVSGIQSLTAYKVGEKPQRIREMDVTNGIAGAGAVMTALIHRQMTGQGQHIDISQLETATHAAIGEHLLEYAANGTQIGPTGNRHRYYAPQGCYQCRGNDKWVVITVRTKQEWQRLCQVMEHPEWITDSRFIDSNSRHIHHDILDRFIEEWTSQRNHYEVMHILQGAFIPAGAVLDLQELKKDPHLRARKYFREETTGSSRTFMGVPFRLSGTVGLPLNRGPDLGGDNEYVSREILGHEENEGIIRNDSEIGTAYDPE
ncbi:MAG: CoA transferase [Desulfobulbaceae bacterium]|nr:CoA transferase [Desulfobulbaceae bacterium]